MFTFAILLGLKDPEAPSAMYQKTKQLVEKLEKISFTLLVILSPICFEFPKAIFCYWDYFTSESGNAAFALPFEMWLVFSQFVLKIGGDFVYICVYLIRRLPFDWRNPYGYLAAVLIQYVVGLYLFLFATCVLPTTLGAYMLARTFAKDLMICINSINDRVNINGNKVEIIKQYSKMLKIHSFLLELS